jgi:polyferredoxin
MTKPALQRARLLAQMGFFTLFTVTPIFDLFRYDLTERHAYFLTMPWHLGIDELIAGTGDAKTAAINIILFLFLPVLGTLGLIIGIAWKWGRLYCGWLCPHFSVVETINRLMLYATGKHSVWDKKQTPPWEPDGTPMPRDWRYWFAVVPAAIGFAFAWAVVGLTYLMPPFQVYGGLLNFTLLRWEVIFLCAATTVLTLEFLWSETGRRSSSPGSTIPTATQTRLLRRSWRRSCMPSRRTPSGCCWPTATHFSMAGTAVWERT